MAGIPGKTRNKQAQGGAGLGRGEGELNQAKALDEAEEEEEFHVMREEWDKRRPPGSGSLVSLSTSRLISGGYDIFCVFFKEKDVNLSVFGENNGVAFYC